MFIRSLLKDVVERALIWSGATAIRRRLMSQRVLVLAYHNVVPDGAPISGDLANHLPLSSFVAQLHALRSTHEIIPLSEALHPARVGATMPRAAITFDDAYRGAVNHAVPELVRLGIPATIFVAPAFIGGRSFWWDALAQRGAAGLDPAVRTHALDTLRGEDDAVRTWASETGRELFAVPDIACAASVDELTRAAAQTGIALGSHTWGHPNLTRLSPNELDAELIRPLAWLRERVPNVLPWIAYPYGLFDATVARAAHNAGYDAALGISGGWFARAPIDRFSLPRVNVPPGMSARGFALRGAGFLTD